jgi:hypothetical protein
VSTVWLAVLVVGIATVVLKGAGTLVLAGRPLPRPAAGVAAAARALGAA